MIGALAGLGLLKSITSQHEGIVPSPGFGAPSCMVSVNASLNDWNTRIINQTNLTFYKNIPDIVIKPGSTDSISLVISRLIEHNITVAPNVTNGTVNTITTNVTSNMIYIKNSPEFFWGIGNNNYTSASNGLGVFATYSRQNETLTLQNPSVNVTLTFNAALNATLGSYYVSLPTGNLCHVGVGEIGMIVTVGTQPYNGNTPLVSYPP